MTTDYQQTPEEVIRALGSDAQRGLTTAEARARLARYGRNQLAAEPVFRGGESSSRSSRTSLVILLLIATAISAALWLYERDSALPYEAIAISAVVLLNAVHGLRPAGASRIRDCGVATDGGRARARDSRR